MAIKKQGTGMRAVLILAMAMVLCACSVPTAAVRSQVVSYDDAIEDITNKLLVLNILRAKDKAPLHFDEIPSIHESIQATGSLAFTIPYGPRPPSWTRNSFAPGVSLQVSPSFEIDHLDTKDFVTGLASPIDPKFVKYWLDRGLDRRIVLLLFFSAVDIVDADSHSTIRIRNSPGDALDALDQAASDSTGEDLRCDQQSDFQHYLRFINTLTTFSANSYVERRKLADGIQIESEPPGAKAGADSAIKDLATIATLDPTKFQWVREANKNTYTIYAISSEPKTALCDSGYQLSTSPETPTHQTPCSTTVFNAPVESGADQYRKLTFSPAGKRASKRSPFCEIFDKAVRTRETSPATPGAGDTGATATALRLEIRSVGEIIQFLGDLLEYQENLAKLHKQHPQLPVTLNNPLTFGYCLANKIAGCNDVFFNLRHDDCNTRFSLNYRHRKYSVPNYNAPDDSEDGSSSGSCPAEFNPGGNGPTPAKDHTLEILAVVHQLVDLQKSAQDIKETPYIQVLP
jgi:hypothetical protein